jgi:short-subunit dehydrogenase
MKLWLSERAQIRHFLKQEPTLKTRNDAQGTATQRGAVVNISSSFGLTAHATAGAYPASKSGVLITTVD